MARDGGPVGGWVELEVLRVVGLLLLLLLGVVLGHLARPAVGGLKKSGPGELILGGRFPAYDAG